MLCHLLVRWMRMNRTMISMKLYWHVARKCCLSFHYRRLRLDVAWVSCNRMQRFFLLVFIVLIEFIAFVIVLFHLNGSGVIGHDVWLWCGRLKWQWPWRFKPRRTWAGWYYHGNTSHGSDKYNYGCDYDDESTSVSVVIDDISSVCVVACAFDYNFDTAGGAVPSDSFQGTWPHLQCHGLLESRPKTACMKPTSAKEERIGQFIKRLMIVLQIWDVHVFAVGV